MTAPLYAIGDIHGQNTMLEDALARIDRDGGASCRVVFVGDYVDRGPDSRAVIETLASGVAEGRDWVCLKGNHDRMFEWFLDRPAPRHDPHMLVGYHWLHERIGGVETLASYGVKVPERIRMKDLAAEVRAVVPDHHSAFLRGLHLMHRQDGRAFVHAGIRPGVALDAQDEEDLVWIREEFLNDTRDHGAYIVHGHTPVKTPDLCPNRLNIDTGAGYDRPLSTVVFDEGKTLLLGPEGRVAL